MDPIDINYKLKKMSYSQAAVARKLKVKRQVVNQVINGRKQSARVKREIARIIGMDIKDIWPKDKAA